METPERRIANLLSFGKAWSILYSILAGIVIVTPIVTIGTEYHESAISFSTYFGVGVFLGPAYVKWARFVRRWLSNTGRSFAGPWFLFGLFGGILPVGTFVYYWVFKLFEHNGDWSTTLAFSWEVLYRALLLNMLMACMVGLLLSVLVHYRDGENIVIRNGKPSQFWHVIVFLLLTLIAPVLVITASYLIQ